MQTVSISELRANLLSYLKQAGEGHEIVVTSHGERLASIVAPTDQRQRARAELAEIAKTIVIGDVLSPIDAEWNAQK